MLKDEEATSRARARLGMSCRIVRLSLRPLALRFYIPFPFPPCCFSWPLRISSPLKPLTNPQNLTDMVQIISLLTMERPRSFSASDLCNEKVRVLSWMPALSHEDTLIGQYGPSTDKPGFKDEEDVADDSICVTFCAAVARVENERWSGVPFILKAGKGLCPFPSALFLPFPPLYWISPPCFLSFIAFKGHNVVKAEMVVPFSSAGQNRSPHNDQLPRHTERQHILALRRHGAQHNDHPHPTR